MDSLFSDFHRLKETNPFAYTANVGWWRAVILGAARSGYFSCYQPYANVSSPSSPSSTTLPLQAKFESTGSTIGILELDLDYITTKLQNDGRTPESLHHVLLEMSMIGDVIARTQFLPWAGVGWTAWILQKVVAAPLLWSLKQLSLSNPNSPNFSSSPTLATAQFNNAVGGHGSGPISPGRLGSTSMTSRGQARANGLSYSRSGKLRSQDTYVILPFVCEAANRILSLQQESVNYHLSDNVMTFADFRQKFSRSALLPIRGKLTVGDEGPLVLTDRDLEILLRYMQYELKVLVVGSHDASKQQNKLQDHEMVIKFATKEGIRNKSNLDITVADRGIVELRAMCTRLDNQILDLEGRIAELNDKARICVRNEQQKQAVSALRQKKIAEEYLHKRLQALETVNSIIFRIQASETDAEILQYYKLGSNTMACVMATKGSDGKQLLSKDSVDSTMDQFAELFADQQEVDQALSIGTSMIMETSLDEHEIMAELDALEAQQKQLQQQQQPPSQQQQEQKQQQKQQKQQQATTSKRVAEVPEELLAKHRKLSQSSVQSHRRNSTEAALSRSVTPPETTSPLAVATEEPEEEQDDGRINVRMAVTPTHASMATTVVIAGAGAGAVNNSQEEVVQDSSMPMEVEEAESAEQLSSQDHRELAQMLLELEGIHVPEDNHASRPTEDVESETASTAGKVPMAVGSSSTRATAFSREENRTCRGKDKRLLMESH
ncbi:hypothetical protein BG004_000828 [Podila humilis]|nr:hypothetical protein BG004_000828 [Podila humilis]